MLDRILVTGATGQIGREVVKGLLERGADVTVMDSGSGRTVLGVPHVNGNFADPESLQRAFAGFDVVFLLLPLVPKKLEFARAAVEAARAVGVRHIVRSSGAGADKDSPVAIARLQGAIDHLVEGSGLKWTLLRPNFFMQNWTGFNLEAVRRGAVFEPTGNGAVSVIDVRDIAEAAATVLVEPHLHEMQTYTLTGPTALTQSEQIGFIAELTKRQILYVDTPEQKVWDALRAQQVPETMIEWIMSLHAVVKNGWAGAVSDDLPKLIGRRPRRFEAFAAENVALWTSNGNAGDGHE